MSPTDEHIGAVVGVCRYVITHLVPGRIRDADTGGIAPDVVPGGTICGDINGRIDKARVIRIEPALKLQLYARVSDAIEGTGSQVVWAADGSRVIAAEIHTEHIRTGSAIGRIRKAVAAPAETRGLAECPLALPRPARVRVQREENDARR